MLGSENEKINRDILLFLEMQVIRSSASLLGAWVRRDYFFTFFFNVVGILFSVTVRRHFSES